MKILCFTVKEPRFCGSFSFFTWEQRELGTLGQVAMCRRIFKEQTTTKGDIPFYKIGTFGGIADAFISRALFEEYKAKFPYPHNGAILISASGSIGRTVVYSGENEYFQDSNIVWLAHDERITDSFLKHLYSVIHWAGIEGSTIKRLYNDNILKTEIFLPPIAEQIKLSKFLDSIDNLITLHQRKENDLLFQKIRRIIAKKMDFAWEQRELGKIGSTYTGLSGKSKADFGHGQGKFITYMNVFTNPIANLGTIEPIEIDDKQNTVLVGDVFFTTSSETPDEVGMSCVLTENSPNTYLNSFCFGYRPTIKFDNYYLAYMLRSASFRAKITFLAQGISRYNISKNKVMEIEIPIPEFNEQQKIGAYFKNIYLRNALKTLGKFQTVL